MLRSQDLRIVLSCTCMGHVIKIILNLEMIHIIFILIKPFSDPSCPMDGGIVILEETTPIRIEMFHHRIKVITQNNFGLICSDPSF